MTRPFHCDKDHSQATHCVLYGHTRQGLFVKEIDFYIIDNITPHRVKWDIQHYGFMPIAVTCGIIGCGFEVQEVEEGIFKVFQLDVDYHLLPIEEFIALHNFRNTGYEI